MSKACYRIQANSVTKTYAYCRIAARDALKEAQRRKIGGLYFSMMAGVFAAFTVEAFLNHLGEHKVQDWAVLERKLGPREKLMLLRQVLRLQVDEGRRPFQTLGSMLRLRDALAHGKTTEGYSDRTVKSATDDDHCPQPEWKTLCSIASVSRMVEDAEAIVYDLSAQAKLGTHPFACLGGFHSGTTKLKP